jgi:hypothetical protein
MQALLIKPPAKKKKNPARDAHATDLKEPAAAADLITLTGLAKERADPAMEAMGCFWGRRRARSA